VATEHRLAVLLVAGLSVGCTPAPGALPSATPPEPPPRGAAADDDDDPLNELCALRLQCSEPLVYNEKQTCEFAVEREDGTVEYEGPTTAWGRGRSSSRVSKTQYGLELQTESGEEAAANLLGMGRESDWVLNGNWYDRSLVRNKTGYDLFRALGDSRYAPQSALCELELDGEYRGVYSLIERIKRDDDRVDIDDVDDGSAFVVKKLDHECFYRLTTARHCWKLISPNDAALPDGTAEALTSWFVAWEAALLGPPASSADDGAFEYVDLDSAVDVVLLEEFMKNEDAWTHSMHAWKDVGGKMHFAPWDLDMTWGNLWYHDTYGSPETWVNHRPEMVTGMSDTEPFRERMVERWAELRAGPMATEAVLERISANQAILGDAVDRNFDRWPIEDVDYGNWFYKVYSYAEEDAWIRSWIETRLAWMDANVGDY